MLRSQLIDAIKVIASQLILIHHMALYTPMSEVMAEAMPQLMETIESHGRYAVQCFLVIAGFLAHRSLADMAVDKPWSLIAQRFKRLAPLLWLALALVVINGVIFQPYLKEADWLSPTPRLLEFLAHLLFLQDIASIPSISAGAWYVAIDMQLYVFSVGVCLLIQRLPLGQGLVASLLPLALILFSGMNWSQDERFDEWAIYFYYAYGLGWLAGLQSPRRSDRLTFVVAWAVMTWLGLHESDPRHLMASGCALALFLLGDKRLHPSGRFVQLLVHLSNCTYALFVSHFALIIVCSALWKILGWQSFQSALSFFMLTWLVANVASAGLWRLNEYFLKSFKRSHARQRA